VDSLDWLKNNQWLATH